MSVEIKGTNELVRAFEVRKKLFMEMRIVQEIISELLVEVSKENPGVCYSDVIEAVKPSHTIPIPEQKIIDELKKQILNKVK